MLDWDNLIATPEGEMDDVGQKTGESVPACPGKMPVVPAFRDRQEANNDGAFMAIVPAVPAVPAKKSREGRKTDEKEGEKIAPGGGDAARKFAPEIEAVVLILAVHRKKFMGVQGLSIALDELLFMPPDEQVRHWRHTAIGLGIKPWLLIHPKAPGTGMDCMGCRHIHSAFEFIPDFGRRCFTWLCELGHPIHVHDHGGERVLVAPPECNYYQMVG